MGYGMGERRFIKERNFGEHTVWGVNSQRVAINRHRKVNGRSGFELRKTEGVLRWVCQT